MKAGSERCYLSGSEDGGRGPQLLKARKGKETDLDSVPVKINVCCFKATKIVVICYSSNKEKNTVSVR